MITKRFVEIIGEFYSEFFKKSQRAHFFNPARYKSTDIDTIKYNFKNSQLVTVFVPSYTGNKDNIKWRSTILHKTADKISDINSNNDGFLDSLVLFYNLFMKLYCREEVKLAEEFTRILILALLRSHEVAQATFL